MLVLYVDFNEMLEPDLVLLSKEDNKIDVDQKLVLLKEGMKLTVIMDDIDENGNIDNLIATGVVEKNSTKGWGEHVKWCCRIDNNGIRHQSDCRR
jgi:hypothetical protein